MLWTDHNVIQPGDFAVESFRLRIFTFVIERAGEIVSAEERIRMFEAEDFFAKLDSLACFRFGLSMLLLFIQCIDKPVAAGQRIGMFRSQDSGTRLDNAPI